MKKIILMLISGVFPFVCSAANLEDVEILSVKPGQENFEVKMHAKEGPPGSYFIMDIMKSDVDSFVKMNLVVKKMMQKDSFKLNLEIPSFSPSPSGSYYRSEGITFSAQTEREPNSTKNLKSNPKKKSK